MAERGLSVDHTTIFRWVQHYAPELDKRSRPHFKACNDSWRVDETYIKVKKVWKEDGMLTTTATYQGTLACACESSAAEKVLQWTVKSLLLSGLF
jgi:hypothetical protein